MTGTRSPRVLLHYADAESVSEIIHERFPDVPLATCSDNNSLASVLDEFQPDVAFSVKTDRLLPFPRDVLLSSATLKWIAVGGVGIDHLAPWNPDKVTVTNMPGTFAHVMAQYCMGAIYYFACAFANFRSNQSRHEWQPECLRTIADATLLVVGLGATGKALADMAMAIGMSVKAIRSKPGYDDRIGEIGGPDNLPEFLSQADYIAITVPLKEDTRHLFDRDAFAAMRNDVVIINVSRGDVIEETALLEALESRQIRGAALDVFSTEPLPPAHPLWEFEQVLVSPHSASFVAGWDRRMTERFCGELDGWIAGGQLSNVVVNY